MAKSIMIVDDSVETLSLYGIMLERHGYRVLKALDIDVEPDVQQYLPA